MRILIDESELLYTVTALHNPGQAKQPSQHVDPPRRHLRSRRGRSVRSVCASLTLHACTDQHAIPISPPHTNTTQARVGGVAIHALINIVLIWPSAQTSCCVWPRSLHHASLNIDELMGRILCVHSPASSYPTDLSGVEPSLRCLSQSLGRGFN